MKKCVVMAILFLVSNGVRGFMSFELIALQKSDVAIRVAAGLDKELHIARFRTFADGEINVELEKPELFAGKTAVIVQSTGNPVNAHVLGVAFLAKELKNAGAQKVIAVLPYFGYSRQERSNIAGKHGHAKVVADLLQAAGIEQLYSVELHDDTIMEQFSIPVHNLRVERIIANHILKEGLSRDDTCMVAPDKGAAEFIESIAEKVGIGSLIFSKERFATDKTRVIGIAGSCEGSIGILADDIIATGGTAMNVCNTLPERGYLDVIGYFVHPVLAGPALDRIAGSCFSKIFVGNTIPLSDAAKAETKIAQFDVSPVIIDALKKSIGG